MNQWDIILSAVIILMTVGFAVGMIRLRKKQHELKMQLLQGSTDRLFTSEQGE